MKLSTFFNYSTLLIWTLLLASFSVNAQHRKAHSVEQNAHVPQQNTFLSIMDTMMIRMDDVVIGISPSHDFMVQMIPHHQGAIEMSAYEIQHGKNFNMIQLAKSIQAEQNIEIQLMNSLKKDLPTDITITPRAYKKAMDESMEVMMKNMPSNNELKDVSVDVAFARVMIPHHQAAINMAKVVLKFSKDLQTNIFAKQIISSEEIEIGYMQSFLNKQ